MNDQNTKEPPTAPSGEVGSQRLLEEAERMGDKEESVFSAELFLLRKIAQTSSDLVKAYDWEEFCEASGGICHLTECHAQAVRSWEQWQKDGEDWYY